MWTRRRLFKLLLFFITFFLLAEIAARFFSPSIPKIDAIYRKVDDPRHFVMRENMHFEFAGIQQSLPEPVLWQTNSQGIRDDHEISKEARSEIHRILVYGDSETFGHSINLDQTWQKRVSKMNPKWQTINLGVVGYNAQQVAEHVKRTASEFSPDLIVYQFNSNDQEPVFNPPSLPIDSKLLGFLTLLVYVPIHQKRMEEKRSPTIAIDAIVRIARISKTRKVPFLLLFTRSIDTQLISMDQELSRYFENAKHNPNRYLDLSSQTENCEYVDGHMIDQCHAKIAKRVFPVLEQMLQNPAIDF